jgi:hypothetical protein
MATQRKVRTDEYGPTGPQTIEAPEAKTPTVSFSKLKNKVQEPERKTKVYSILNGGGIWCKVPSTATTRNPIRQIRYCPNEPSIYVDEQSQFAIREQVAFREGSLLVGSEFSNLQDFLDAHPDNVANGGNMFFEVNTEHNAEEELENEFLVHDAIAMVRDMQLDELLPVAMFLNIDPKRKSVEIRRELLGHAKSNPKAFIEMFDNPIVKVKAVLIQAVDFEILKISSEAMRWRDSGQIIITTPAGQDTLDVMARFCLTDKGSLVYAEITNRLSKL